MAVQKRVACIWGILDGICTALLLFTAVVAFCAVKVHSAEAAQQRPNILFIMSDDHTTQAIGVYGSRLAALNPTPVIDGLAKNGMRFDRVFCNNSICTPSRASIITGQYSQTNGVTILEEALDSKTLEEAIGPKKQYLPLEMRKAGYQTAMVGKWHLGAEPAAFDYYCVLPGQGQYSNPSFCVRGDNPWPKNVIKKDGQHSSDAITDISLEWLKNGRDKTKPFFLMHHFKAPHDMFTNAKRYDSYLEDVEIPEPDNLFSPPAGSDGSRGKGSGIGRTHTPWGLARKLGIPEKLDDREYAKASYQKFLKRYLRCVKGVDDNVKRLIDYLTETGELDNTVIMYTGDQGVFLGEHDLMDKRWMYEESMRMPFIVHYPKMVKAGSTNNWLINNTDFAPTILDLAGVATPDYMQGRSFVPALKGDPKPDDWRTVTYYRYWMHMAHHLAVPAHFGVRSDRYKLIFFYNPPVAWEFYDLEKDPSEMHNAYADPAYSKIIADLKVQLKQTRQTLGETDEKRLKVQAIIDAHWEQ